MVTRTNPTRSSRRARALGGVSRLAPGDVIASRELTTIRSERIVVPALDTLAHLFRSQTGCPICNMHFAVDRPSTRRDRYRRRVRGVGVPIPP